LKELGMTVVEDEQYNIAFYCSPPVGVHKFRHKDTKSAVSQGPFGATYTMHRAGISAAVPPC